MKRHNANRRFFDFFRSNAASADARKAPKSRGLRLEALEERQLLSATPFDSASEAQKGVAIVSDVPLAADYSSALVAPADYLAQDAARDEGDLAIVLACGLNPDNTGQVKWNADGRLTYFNCNGSAIETLDLSSCSALGNVSVYNCANLTSLDLSGLQSLGSVYVYNNPNLTDLNLDDIVASGDVRVSGNGGLTSWTVTGLSAKYFYCHNNGALARFSETNC